MRAFVDPDLCIGCTQCAGICPEVFSLTPGEPAQAVTGPVPDDQKLAVQEAADSCPVAAIEVR